MAEKILNFILFYKFNFATVKNRNTQKIQYLYDLVCFECILSLKITSCIGIKYKFLITATDTSFAAYEWFLKTENSKPFNM